MDKGEIEEHPEMVVRKARPPGRLNLKRKRIVHRPPDEEMFDESKHDARHAGAAASGRQ